MTVIVSSVTIWVSKCFIGLCSAFSHLSSLRGSPCRLKLAATLQSSTRDQNTQKTHSYSFWRQRKSCRMTQRREEGVGVVGNTGNERPRECSGKEWGWSGCVWASQHLVGSRRAFFCGLDFKKALCQHKGVMGVSGGYRGIWIPNNDSHSLKTYDRQLSSP